jgi:Zn-dependent protease with chaperone function
VRKGFAVRAVALLARFLALRRRVPEPVPVIGVELGVRWLPELTARVARIAAMLNVRPPARIVIGLDVAAFVTTRPINLRGQGLLPAAETLYLPACALRALDRVQLDAVIGHELAHFRGAELGFTERFLPVFVGLRNAINRIRREREFEADRVGAEVASPEALAQALVKFSLLMFSWTTFRSGNAQYLGSGHARRNLCVDYLASVASLLTTVDREAAREVVLSAHLAHPTDTHPSLHERVRAFGFDAGALFEKSVGELRSMPAPGDHGVSLEEAITSIENEWMSIPGTPTVMDTDERLPVELTLRIAARRRP